MAAIILILMLMGCRDNPLAEETRTTTWASITENVNGSLSPVENLRVLTLHGTFYEIGYAHGYLLGPEIFQRQENILTIEGILEDYNNRVLPNINRVHFPDEYSQEISGLFDGVKARTTNGEIYSQVLGRVVDLNDAIALNCLNAFASLNQCSSFSAWGNMTRDGQVLTGYNHDCLIANGHTGKWYVIVRIPQGGVDAIPTVCVGLAGDMNMHTAMNGRGVTLACHSVADHLAPTSTSGFTSEGILFHKLAESVGDSSPVSDIKNILNTLYTVEAEALMMSWPGMDNGSHAAALEIDGNLLQNHGYAIRYPDKDKNYIIQTNHFALRYTTPEAQHIRYGDIQTPLESIASGETPPLTVDSAWNLLASVQLGGDFLTEIAVVFEPEKRLMHVALAQPGLNAHDCQRVTLNIPEMVAVPVSFSP